MSRENRSWFGGQARLAVSCLASLLLLLTHVQTTSTAAPELTNGAPIAPAPQENDPANAATAAAPQASGTVVIKANVALNIRRGPHSGYYNTNGSYPRGKTVTVECRTYGQTLTGTVRKSRVWYRVSKRKYISQAYVDIVKEPHVCSETKVNDYPYAGQCPSTGGPIGGPTRDEWNYTKGQCTSFAAFRADQRLDVNLSGLGNARDWNNNFNKSGTMPLVGSIAVAEGGALGHVAYVAQVNSNGTFTVEEYNWSGPCKYGTRTGLTVSSNGFSSFIYP